MKVIVLGAGVMGVTTAYFLARNGHEVTVLEKEPAAAMSCSHANGGQLSYSHTQTWANQVAPASLVKNFLRRKSPILIQDFNKESLKWMFKFYKNSFAQKARSNGEKIFQLAIHSKETLAQIMSQETGLNFSYEARGNLHFYCNKKLFDEAVQKTQTHEYAGYKSQILSPQECVEKERTLVKILDAQKLVGGIFYHDDASGDCFSFAANLAKICQEKYGVVFKYGIDVRNIFTNYKKITGINTSKGVFVADAYVYALGATGNYLLRGVKINSEIYPVKGYSISIKADDVDFIAPNCSLTDCENKVVYSRIGDVFRAAGCIEISGLNKKENRKMLNFLESAMRSTFSDFGDINSSYEWHGFRPFRPNSLPLICQVKKYGNLFLNTGHGALGWTLSAGSAKILSDLISTGRIDKNLKFLEEEGDLL